MKRSQVSIPWKEGLHLRPATKLVKRAMAFQSSISLKLEERVADARSILAIVLLCATFGTVVSVEASGVDEDDALASVLAVFESENAEGTEWENPIED